VRPADTKSRVWSPCEQAIRNKYGLTADQLRVFIHYQPSYYHLHVHFMHIRRDAGAGMAVGKAHLLSDIIGEILQPNLTADGQARRSSSVLCLKCHFPGMHVR
jgi:hypothetical protein